MRAKTQNILLLIQACKKGNKTGQRKLYELYYSYGMSVSLRYASNRDEAREIFNEAFYKVFSNIHHFKEGQDFKQWLRAILINTAIDYHRKYHKLGPFIELGGHADNAISFNDGLEKLKYDDIMESVQQLPPRYRLVFNLYAVDGLTHPQIAEKLDISVGASKSNFAKARKKLMESLIAKGYLKSYQHG